MKPFVALALLLLGGWLIYVGYRRAESVTGVADSLGKTLANKWDGKARQPEHIYYYVGGGVCVLAGVVVMLRKSGGT